MTTTPLPAKYRAELLASGITSSLVDSLIEGKYFYELAGNFEVCEFLNRQFARFGWKAIKEQSRGWVFRGLDPVTWEQMQWGCFKPDRPRQDPSKPEKWVKYDAPIGIQKRVFIVPSAIDWQREYSDSSVEKIICEGFKKTASMVGQGYRAIGIDGIWTGIRKQADGSHELIPDLKLAAQPGTKITLFFDYETKPKTRKQVQLAQLALGRALIAAGCVVKIARLPGPEKGVDDFLVAHGKQAVDQVLAEAIDFQEFIDSLWDFAIPEISYEPNLEVDQRYLSVKIPETGLIVVRSPMGTGKTEVLKGVCAQASSVLSVTHRTTLGRQAAERLGLALYSEANIKRVNRLEITVDSLYKLPTYGNRYSTVILDEVEQILAHMLTSDTCKGQRVAILQKFAYFVQSADRVILQQAELSDSCIDYISQLRGGEVPYVITNKYSGSPRVVGWYEQHRPDKIIEDLQQALEAGEKVLIACYSRKKVKRLEDLIRTKFPEKVVRVVHGDNSTTPEVIGFVERINEEVKHLDALIFTPSMSTGVSIDTPVFNSCWGIFDTAECHASELLQMMGRYRPQAPWFIWSARRGAGFIGSFDPAELQAKEIENNRRTGILTHIDPETGLESSFHLDCWAQIRARNNASKLRQRDVLRKLLIREGHHLFEVEGDAGTLIAEALKAAKLRIEQAEAEATAAAEDITAAEAEALEYRAERLTEGDRHKLNKYRLKQGYQLDVTPELVIKDREGRLLRSILALEELLFPETAIERDSRDMEKLKFLPDRRHRTLKRTYREHLGLKEFLNLERQWSRDDLEQLDEMIAKYRNDIKKVLNLSIPENASPCWVVSQLLEQLGLKVRSRREGGRGEQVRFYQLDREHYQFVSDVLERRRRLREKKRSADPPREDSGSQPCLYLTNTSGVDYEQPTLPI